MDIDRFFTHGPDAPFETKQIFSDREQQLDVLHRRLIEHCSHTWPVARLMDFQRPAANVVVVSGEGGMGKSTLARHFARLVAEGELPGLPEHRACPVIDFADPSNQSFETVMLRIRAALGRLGRSWLAFDLALAVYWERKHPGETFSGFLRHSQLPESLQLSEQVGATLEALLGGIPGVSLGYRIIEAAGRSTVKAGRLRALQRELPALDPVLRETDPDRMIGYMPVLLAADLERLRARRPTTAVCLLDTFEIAQASASVRGGLEDLAARLVYLMPNVLFLATGRRPLRWADPVRSVGLTYGGAARWPGLAAGDHLPLPGLDADSAQEYLRTRLTIDDRAAIPAPVRRRIIAGADGFPLYLELSVGLYEQFLLKGERPAAEVFGHPFPELVLRVMRDLSTEDRDILRAAALLEAFDEELLRVMLPDVRGRAVERFLDRQFVRSDPSVWPAHRLHENLRHGVLACDEHTDDGWTRAERHARLRKAVEHLTHLATSIWSERTSHEIPLGAHSLRTVAAFRLVLQAAREHGILPLGLGQIVYTVSELGHWQVLTGTPELSDQDAPELARLIEVARLSARSDLASGTRYAAVRRSAGELDHNPFSDYLRFELGQRAHATGDLEAADAHFSAIRDDDSPLGVGAKFGRAGSAIRRSDYPMVTALMSTVPADGLDRIRSADMLGNVHLHNARFEDAIRLFHEALLLAEQSNAPLWAARAARHLAQSYMWCEPDRALALLPRARELNVSVGELNGLAQCDLAASVAHAFRGERDRAEELIVAAADRFAELGAARELLPAPPIEVLLHASAGRTQRANEVAARLADAAARGRPECVPVWIAVTALWTGRPDLFDFRSIGWLDAPEPARGRWMDPLRRMAEATPR